MEKIFNTDFILNQFSFPSIWGCFENDDDSILALTTTSKFYNGDTLDCSCSFLIFQTTGLLLSALGNLSAMTDLGDSKDDAESLLEQLKEFTKKSMVSGKVLELVLLLKRNICSINYFSRSDLSISLNTSQKVPCC